MRAGARARACVWVRACVCVCVRACACVVFVCTPRKWSQPQVFTNAAVTTDSWTCPYMFVMCPYMSVYVLHVPLCVLVCSLCALICPSYALMCPYMFFTCPYVLHAWRRTLRAYLFPAGSTKETYSSYKRDLSTLDDHDKHLHILS